MKSRWDTSRGMRILWCDFSDFGTNVAALAEEVDAADAMMMAEPLGSVLLLADFRGTVTSSAVVDLFKKSTARTQGYSHRQAIVGLKGIQKMLVQAVAWFSRETFVLFDTPEEALTWLAQGSGAGLVIKGS